MAKAETLARALQNFGILGGLRRVGGWRGVLIVGHYRIGEPAGTELDPALFSATAEGLDAQLTVLRRDAELIGPDDLDAALAARGGRHVLLTFDDGYRDSHDAAFGVLRRHEARALFFLATGFLDRPRVPWWDEISWMVTNATTARIAPMPWWPEGISLDGDRRAATRAAQAAYVRAPAADGERLLVALAQTAGAGRAPQRLGDDLWLTWDMVRAMRGDGQAFGAHTVEHPVLARCDPLRQAREVGRSVQRISDELGARPDTFAYPIGARDAFDDVTRATLRAEGITRGFSFYGGFERAGRAHDLLDLRRTYVTPQMSPAMLRARVVLPQVFARETHVSKARPPAERYSDTDLPAPEVLPNDAIAPPSPPGEPAVEHGVPGSTWGAGVKRGIVWSTLTFGMSKALSLLSILILARLLVPAEFGVVAAVVAYMSIIELVSDLGMKPSVVYDQERGITSRVQTAYTVNVIAATVLAGFGVLLAPTLAGVFRASDYVDLFRLGAVNILLVGLANIHDALLLRDLAFNRRIVPQFVRDILRVGVSVGLAFAGLGAASMVWGYLAGTAGWVIVNWMLSPLRPKLQFDRTAARSMASYGAGATSLMLLSAILIRADVVVIGAVMGTTELGIYTVAFRLPEALLASVAYTLAVVAFPALAQRRSANEGGLASATLALLRYQTLYAATVGAGLAVLAAPLVTELFGERWRLAGPVMAGLAVSFALSTAVFPMGDLLKAVNRQRILVNINLVKLPLLVACLVLAAQSSLQTVAWTLAAFHLAFAVVITGYVARELRVKPAEIIRAMTPGLAAGSGVAAGAIGALVLVDGGLQVLLIGTLAGIVGGALALRVAAPTFARELVRQARSLWPARRRRPSTVAGD